MGKISGTLSDEAKIYVINEATNICESSNTHPAGNYEIDHLAQTTKTVVAVFTSDNSSKSFANVTPIVSAMPLEWDTNYSGNEMTFADSNTRVTRGSGTLLWSYAYSAIKLPTSGKSYIEWDNLSSDISIFGVTTALLSAATNSNLVTHANTCAHYASTGNTYQGSSISCSQLGPMSGAGIYGLAINRDDHFIKFAKNNTWETINTTIPNSSFDMWLIIGLYNVNEYGRVNCGQHTFNYSPPSGYTAGLYN